MSRFSWMASMCSVGVLLNVATASAEDNSSERVNAVLKSLQERVAALEERSRRDKLELLAAKQKIRTAERSGLRVARVQDTPNEASFRASAPVVAVIAKSGFDGPYVAITGGNRFTSHKQDRFYDYYSYPYYGTYYGPQSDQQAMKGANIGVAAGYNVTSNNILFGLEGRFRRQFDSKSSFGDSGEYTNPIPRVVFASCCSFPASPVGTQYVGSDFNLVSRTGTKDRISRDYGGDVSARVGLTWNDTLFYTRIGAGVDSIRRVNTVDQPLTITCVAPTGTVTSSYYGYSTATITDCGSRRQGAVTRTSTTAVAPYALIGLGFEQNFGAMFVRLEGNLFTHFSPTEALFRTSTYYTTEINGAVGYRF